ncbi:M48 family metalloprotease [Candidatus Micrarchaeota archaeon]|nr:M48 family metalloprotease [Candidatus Micrarchaeota archaeon]
MFGRLKLAMLLTMTLLFGTLAAIFGAIIWLFGSGMSVGMGLLTAVVFSAVVTCLQWYFAPTLIKWMTRMKEASPEEQSWLYETVERLAQKAGIPKPRVYIVMDPTPNAFAFGRTKSNSNIAVHTGLLEVASKDEAEAVLAHEIGHIKHWDVAVMTLASMVPLLVYYLVLFFGSSRNDENRGGSMILVWLGAMVAQFLSSLIVLHLSRTREYYADAFSAVLTGKPHALRSALAKISYGFPAVSREKYQGLRAFYIADPINSSALSESLRKDLGGGISSRKVQDAMDFERRRGFLETFSTHPLTFKRIEALNEVEKDLKEGKLSINAV